MDLNKKVDDLTKDLDSLLTMLTIEKDQQYDKEKVATNSHESFAISVDKIKNLDLA